MAALFRIVQDDYPPFPEGISQALRDFLLLCFQKEPVMRSSAAKLLEHPWLSNFSKGSNVSSRRHQANDDEDSASAQNESVDKSLDSFNSPLYRSRSTNLTSRSSISSTAKAASLSTSSELAALSTTSHSKSSSPRSRKGPGHNRSGGKKRDALKAFNGVNIPVENESFGATSTHTEVDHLSAFFADDTITLDPYPKQPKPPIIYTTIGDRTPSSSYRTADDSVNRKISLSRQSSPALSDSTTDTKDMMLPAPGMMHVSVNSGFTTDIALGQLHISSGASSLSTPTSISNPTSKVNSHDQMDDSSTIQFPSSDSIEGIHSNTGKDLVVEVANNLHPDEDSYDDDDEGDDWAVTEEFVCDDRTSSLPTGDVAQPPPQSLSSKSINTISNLENALMKFKAADEQLSASKKKLYSSEKSSSRSAGLLANLIDLSFTSNTASSSSRDLAELNMNNKPILNVNNSSFLLSKYQETADDTNFDDVFDGSRTDNHSRETSSQKIISGLSKSSDYTYKQKDEHVLRSKSSDYYESSSSPQNSRPLYRSNIKKPKVAVAIAVSSNSSDRISALNDVSPVVQTRWNDLESSQSTDLLSGKILDPHNVIKHPFKRLGMISEDKDSSDYDFNNDFEIDTSIDFNERLERYRNNAVACSSSSSSGISGNHSSSSRDRVKGIYNRKRFDINSFSTTSAADIDYDSDENDGDKFAGKLRERLQSRKDAEFDSFNNYQFFDEKDFKQDESKDEHFRRSREVVEIMEKIRPDTMEETVIDLCNKLLDLFNRYPDQRDHLITYHGVMPIIDMFEARTSAESKSQGGKILRPYVLRVINKIIEGSTRAQEQISLVGLIPTIMNLFEKSCKVQEQQSNFLSMSYSVYGSNSVDRMVPGSQDFTPNKYSSSVIQVQFLPFVLSIFL